MALKSHYSFQPVSTKHFNSNVIA